jgi:REP element-mobilizing transposase RayT
MLVDRRVGHRAGLKRLNMTLKRRKNIRLSKEAYSSSSLIFSITICTKDRKPLFKDKNWAAMIIDTLKTGPLGKGVKCDAYCLMPDHLHLQVSPINGNLIDLINRWKSYTANLLQKHGLKGSCWQRSFYDHALRKEEDIQTTAEYIVNNPVRAGLVNNWEDYQFSWHRWM